MSAPVAPPPPPPRVVPPPVAPAPPTPAGRRATAIKALHWTELAFMAILLLTAIIVSAIDPPPNPLIWTIAVGFGMVLPTIGAAALAWNLVLIRRDPARARRAITVTQATLLAVVSFGALLLVALGIPNLPVLKFLPASLIVISGVLLGLTRLSSPQDLRPQWTGPGPLRTILRTQTAFLSLVALLGGWGWAVQLTVDPGALTSSRVVSFVVLVTAVVVLVVNARATDLPQRQTLLSAQGAWIVMAVLCALPWLYKGTHRFISSDGVSEGRFLMSEDWLPGGALDPINELILWLAVAGAIPAVLAIVQLRRMPRLSPSITLG